MTKFLAALLIVIALSAVAFAQRNEGANAPIRPGPTMVTPLPRSDERPYSLSVTGKILKVSNDDHSLVIEMRNSPAVEFIIEEKTRKTADKKTELAGKKDLSFADYKPGQTVKITFRVADNKVLEVRLKATPK